MNQAQSPLPRSSRTNGDGEARVQNVRQDVTEAIKEVIMMKATVCRAPSARHLIIYFNPPSNP